MYIKKKQYFCTRFRPKSIFYAPSGGGQFPRLAGTLPGAIAQLVEQRTENPCVPSSILGGTTKKTFTSVGVFLFYVKKLCKNLHICNFCSIFALEMKKFRSLGGSDAE